MRKQKPSSKHWNDREGWHERSDKAYVWPTASKNPVLNWMAFSQPTEPLVKATRGLSRVYRKWKTAQAAMKAVDREFPLST